MKHEPSKGSDLIGAPLATREVFLDTEAYERVKFDFEHPTLMALLGEIASERMRLHVTDITLAEVRRHLVAACDRVSREVEGARSSLDAWKRRAPTMMDQQSFNGKPFDGKALAGEVFARFVATIERNDGTVHRAAERSAAPIFRAYFERLPPFDGKHAKEFPDAFAIDALEAWCVEHGAKMYVVTADGAFGRAAAASEHLLHVDTLAKLLGMATLAQSPEVEIRAGAIAQGGTFLRNLAGVLDDEIDDVSVAYFGDLADGEATAMKRAGGVENLDWKVISVRSESVGMIVSFDVDVEVAVEFEDREFASYDREDGRFYGAENATTSLETSVELRMFVEVDDDGEIKRAEVLSREVDVHDYSLGY